MVDGLLYIFDDSTNHSTTQCKRESGFYQYFGPQSLQAEDGQVPHEKYDRYKFTTTNHNHKQYNRIRGGLKLVHEQKTENNIIYSPNSSYKIYNA